jgi:hypothetical protein
MLASRRSALAAAHLLLFAVLLASPPVVVADVSYYMMANYPASQGGYWLSGAIAIDSSTGIFENASFTLSQIGKPTYSVYAVSLSTNFGPLDIIPTAGGGTAIVLPPGEYMEISGQLNGGPDDCIISWGNSSPTSVLMAGYGPPPSWPDSNIYNCPPSPLDAFGLPAGGNWIIATLPAPTSFTWLGGNTSAPTDWNVAANWNPDTAVPNGAGTKVTFGNQPALNNVVDMISQGQTVGNISFIANTSTTIQSSGGFSLTLDNNGLSTIDVDGTHTIAAPVVLNNDATISGPGTLNLSGGITGSHDLEVDSDLTATSIQVDTLTIGAGATVTIQPIPGGPLAGTITAVPEPSTLILLGIGVISLLASWRWRVK